METNENDKADNIVEITPANLKKNRHTSVDIGTSRVKKRIVGDELSNLGVVSTHAKAPRFTTKVLPVPQHTGNTKPMKNHKKAAPVTLYKSVAFHSRMESLQVPYTQSSRFLVGTLLTYDDDVVDTSPDASDDTTTIGIDIMEQDSPESAVVSFDPNVSRNLLNRMAFMISWPFPGHSEYDLLSASLAVFALEGFAGKRGLSRGVKSYLTLFPAFANDFHLYDCALRGTPSYLIMEGTPQFNYSEESTRHAEMIHDFATFAANRLLALPGLDKSLLSDQDVASFQSVVADWKEAVHSMF
jgi:hypothetical protein